MRILMIANTLPPADLSGVGEQVLQLAAGLRARGHQVEVLGRGRGGARGPKLLFPLTVVPAAWRALRRFRPHVVQVHESDGALAILLARTLAALLDPAPRLVALLQVSYREERRAVRPLRAGGRVLGVPGWTERRFRWFKAPAHLALGRLTAWLADVVLAPSLATASEIARDYAVAPVGVVPNATGALERHAQPPEETDRQPGRLLFVGRLRIRKGVEVLLAALGVAARDRPEASLVVAGDGEHRQALERAATGLGVAARVRFLGRCDPARVRSLFAASHALVVPSIYEGLPLVVLEAMAAGVPVIASRVSGIPDAVEDGITGWLVPSEDLAALAAALVEALADPAEAERRGAAGAARARALFTPLAAAEAWLRQVAPARRHDGDDPGEPPRG